MQKFVWWLSDHPSLSQNLRQKLRKRFARPITGPFDITHEGMNFRLYPSENYCDRVLFARDSLPERVEHEALVPYLKPGMIFVDIGANVGSYSVFVGTQTNGSARLVGFEPHPRTYEKLLYNLKANGLSPDMIFNIGLADEPGQLQLWSDGGSNIGHTSMLKAGTAKAQVNVTVPVARLEDVLAENGITGIDVLKIDIEGFEDRALAGFIEQGEESMMPGVVLLETAHAHLWEQDLMGLLRQRGYRPQFETNENVLLIRDPV